MQEESKGPDPIFEEQELVYELLGIPDPSNEESGIQNDPKYIERFQIAKKELF